MKIVNVTLKNFLPYYGEIEVPLQTDTDAPLILMVGENDRGKTAFLNALQWCLYGFDGNPPEKRAKRRSAINRRAATEGDGETSVTVEFTHHGTVHRIRRYITFEGVDDPDDREPGDSAVIVERPSSGSGYETVISKRDSTEDYNEFMNSILPETASDFFFFDGEKVGSRYAGTQDGERDKDDIRKAIETVLGIQQIQKSIEDLDRYGRKHYSKLYHEAESNVDDLQELKDNIADKEDELQALRTEKDSEDQRLETLEESLAAVKEDIAEAAGYEEAHNDIQELTEALEGDDEDEEDEGLYGELQAKEEEKKEYHTRLGSLITGIGSEHIDDEIEVEGVSGEVEIIRSLLEEPRCVCGTKIGEKERENLEDVLEEMQTDDGRQIIDLNDTASKHIDCLREESGGKDVRGTKVSYHEIREDINRIDQEIEQSEGRIEELKEEIEDINVTGEDLQRLRKQEEDLNDQVIDTKATIERLDRDINKLDSKIDQLKDREDSMEGATDEEERYRTLRNLSEKCRDAWEEIKEEYVKTRRQDVEDHASSVFTRLTNKNEVYKGLAISEDYDLDIITKSGRRSIEEQDPSKGARQIIAYSFIAGLNKYTARDAPIVIDTPIGPLDSTHKHNLIDYLPEFKDQVVILYQPEELHQSDLDQIDQHTTRHLQIRVSEEDPECSVVEEVEPKVDLGEVLVQ
ncbi:AAA family ATPase [Halorarum salinum]|uniref:AAA family ATPase n=1 Tax=Halorarum salinum TaxID=2743089 RepID=A0A7D5QBP9_9EURY|nr:AAA family ATPase [Halobaculum salinum]QLG62020.1 AAA family ATPase [Halobaculum salinum]